MRVAVIGGGVVGVCTAYFLAEAGHEVAVVERRNNVAEQASFGNAGIVAPAYAVPWAVPGAPRRIFSQLMKPESPVFLRAKFDRAMWRWIRQWMAECQVDRYRLNRERMQRVAVYSNEVMRALRDRYQLEYEQTAGYLQLLRGERDVELAQPALEMLAEAGVAHRYVDAETARTIEPGLATTTALAGAIHMPDDEAGNCPLFTKQMRYLAQNLGAEFHFNTEVTGIQRTGSGVSLHIEDRIFDADAVVIAAGADSGALLAALGIRIPLYPVRGYSATAPIRDFDAAPLASVMDEAYKVSITRLGGRIRIAGTAELGATDAGLHDAALRTLVKVGDDWFPQAANYNQANFWSGMRPMLPDGVPVLGATPVRGVWLNVGHGATGWAMAAGCGQIIADLVSGRPTGIDTDGLTLSRYG